jgi:hypothetical protein
MVSWLHSGNPPVNLCPFVRSLVFTIFLALFAGTLGLLAMTSVGVTLAYWFGWLHIDPKAGMFVYVIFGTVLMSAAAGCGLAKGIYELVQYRRRARFEARLKAQQDGTYVYEEEKVKEPNVFWLYLQAMHDKVCPELNIEREE